MFDAVGGCAELSFLGPRTEEHIRRGRRRNDETYQTGHVSVVTGCLNKFQSDCICVVLARQSRHAEVCCTFVPLRPFLDQFKSQYLLLNVFAQLFSVSCDPHLVFSSWLSSV